jgi:hypothetical protein
MRLRFAISGHAPNAPNKPDDAAAQAKARSAEPPDATDNQTRIQAATGS